MFKFAFWSFLFVALTSCGVINIDQEAVTDSEREVRNGVLAGSKHPYVVMLRFKRGARSFLCTASMLSSTVALTAAHCVSGSESMVIKKSSTDIERPVNLWAVHPKFGTLGTADLALVKISKQISLSQYPTLSTQHSAINFKATIVGFGSYNDGSSGFKRYGLIKLFGFLDNPYPDGTFISMARYLFKRSSSTSNQIACPGDSGGPALDLSVSSSPKITSTLSYVGNENCMLISQNAFISTFAHRDWITSKYDEFMGIAPPTPAPSCTLAASPQSISLGQSSSLTLAASGTISQVILNGSVVGSSSGSYASSVSPTGTTVYSGSVSGPGGAGSCSVEVVVTNSVLLSGVWEPANNRVKLTWDQKHNGGVFNYTVERKLNGGSYGVIANISRRLYAPCLPSGCIDRIEYLDVMPVGPFPSPTIYTYRVSSPQWAVPSTEAMVTVQP